MTIEEAVAQPRLYLRTFNDNMEAEFGKGYIIIIDSGHVERMALMYLL